MKYTPGPWKVSKDGCDIDNVGGAGVCTLYADETSDANARLIAAAPDLLEACKAIVAHWRMNDEAYYRSNLATDLLQTIAKAEGK